MSISGKIGRCHYCGHDHGTGWGSPRELEMVAEIGRLQKELDFARAIAKEAPQEPGELPPLPEAVAHILPSNLAEMAKREIECMCYSLPFSNPAEKSVCLFTADQMHFYAKAAFTQPSAPSAVLDLSNAGRKCMSEDECISAGVAFPHYERGVSDAIDACQKIAAHAALAARSMQAASVAKVPEAHNIAKVERASDMSVKVVFVSCHAASVFERAMLAATPATREGAS